MPKKLTKTQLKRLYSDILSKSKKLWLHQYGHLQGMSTADFMAIEKIIQKYQKKMR